MIIKEKISLRRLSNVDLPEVARLHLKAFSDSALSKLGLEPIQRYYEWQLNGPHVCYAIGAFDSEGILYGFCFGGNFRGSLRGFLLKNKRFLTSYVLLHPGVFLNSIVLSRIHMAFRLLKRNTRTSSRPKAIQFFTPSYGILSIAVDPSRQGLGIGKILMDAAEMDAIKKGFTHLHLTVHPTNIQAVKFYLKNGWTKIPLDTGDWAGTMEKLISQ